MLVQRGDDSGGGIFLSGTYSAQPGGLLGCWPGFINIVSLRSSCMSPLVVFFFRFTATILKLEKKKVRSNVCFEGDTVIIGVAVRRLHFYLVAGVAKMSVEGPPAKGKKRSSARSRAEDRVSPHMVPHGVGRLHINFFRARSSALLEESSTEYLTQPTLV